jgi:DNA repair protein SbcC/Rad50
MNNCYEKLSYVLEKVLSNRHPKIESPPSKMDPLFLLLNIKPDLVGFASLNGNSNGDYTKALNKFRELYALHAADWADFDLTLVVCADKEKNLNEDYCKQIERDAYFCRKFVIDISGERNIKTELGRLPFIPLSPEKTTGLKPTVTAHTLLMEHDVKSKLAEYLTVPHTRIVDGIIDDVRNGKFGDLIWNPRQEKEWKPKDRLGKRKIRLKELEISNIRAYKGTHKFDLDADLIVLYGQNGLGKTSFFDAIDFVCTGSEAKLDDKASKDTGRIVNALKHLDAQENESYVKVLLTDNNVSIERRLDNAKRPFVNNQLSNRKDVLMKITDIEDEAMDVRIEHFIRLFRATHLFGQDFQSLTSQLYKESRLSNEIVSRMLALQDYFEAIRKTKEIISKLKKELKQKDTEINDLINSKKNSENEIKQLKCSEKVGERPELINKLGHKLYEIVAKEKSLNIKKKPMEVNTDITTEWSIKIESRIREVVNNIDIIEKTEPKIKGFYLKRQELLKEKKEENLFNAKLKIIKNKKEERKSLLDKYRENIKKNITEESNLIKRNENMAWLLLAKKENARIIASIDEENNKIKVLHEKLLQLTQKGEKLLLNKKAAEDNTTSVQSQIESLNNSIQVLNDFIMFKPEWESIYKLEKELNGNLSRHKLDLEYARKNIQSKKNELQNVKNIQSELANSVSIHQKAQNELQTLLDNIERHISTNNCPVCATSHKSREELLGKLNIQRGIRPKRLEEELKNLDKANNEVQNVQGQLDSEGRILEKIKQEANIKQNKLDEIKQKINNLKEKAKKLELPLEPDSISQIINVRKEKGLKEIQTKKNELNVLAIEFNKMEHDIKKLLKHKSGYEEEVRIAESKKKQFSERLETIKNETLERHISIGFEEGDISNEIDSNKGELSKIAEQVKILREKSQNLNKEINEISGSMNMYMNDLQKKEQKIKELTYFIKEIELFLNELDLSLNVTEQELQIAKKNLIEENARLKELQKEVTNFEIALDFALHSASLKKANQTLNYLNEQIDLIKKEETKSKEWEEYFLKIHKELESFRNNSLKEYTIKYGPLASTIQGRLRTPYGFGKMQLTTGESDIIVKVERGGGNSILPSDYFSSSQINIVALSLFLSATLTQTWSRFAPILLDDPITHFDDLNAYSFIDLIRGFILSEEPNTRHQFIISTCEEKLYRLMKHKFSKMNGKVIIYTFESINEKGPVWSKEKY